MAGVEAKSVLDLWWRFVSGLVLNDPLLRSSFKGILHTWAETTSRLYGRVVLMSALVRPYRLDAHGLHVCREG